MSEALAQPADLPPKNLPWGGKGNLPMEWAPIAHVEEFLFNLKVENKSKDYIRMVRVALAHLSLFCRTQGIKHPDQIERTHLLLFQAYLNDLTDRRTGKPLKTQYKQQLMKYVRSWIIWAVDVGYIQQNPWIRIKIGRQSKQPKPLEPEQIAAIFDAHRQQAFTIDPFHYHRREVILVLLYGWGLRIHELQALNATQFDARVDWVVAQNKGGSSKSMPYGPSLKQVVHRYLIQRAKHAKPGEDALLVDRHGERLSIGMIRHIVQSISNRAGVPINPHRLRDSFGTTLLDYDVEVERIMKLMGHTQASQTLAYSRVNDHKVKESYDRVMEPIIGSLVGGQTGRTRVCECIVRHPSSAHEIYTLRGRLFEAQVDHDDLTVQVITAQLTTACPGLRRGPAGIHDAPPER